MTTVDAAATIRRSAGVTLTSTGVRLFEHTSVPLRIGVEEDFDTDGEGVADLAGLRCDFTKTVPAGVPRVISTIAQHVADRHPWVLRDEELAALESDELKNQTAHYVYVGGASFPFHPQFTDVCFQPTGDPDSHRRNPSDPTWVVEALLYVDDADVRDADVVRDIPCLRFGFHVDLERHRHDLERPHDRRWRGAPHLVGEVWLDEEQLVRRISCEQIERRRRRPATDESQEDQRSHTVTEFWDYGVESSIPVPVVRKPNASTFEVCKCFAVGLWRRRREYRRRQPE